MFNIINQICIDLSSLQKEILFRNVYTIFMKCLYNHHCTALLKCIVLYYIVMLKVIQEIQFLASLSSNDWTVDSYEIP